MNYLRVSASALLAIVLTTSLAEATPNPRKPLGDTQAKKGKWETLFDGKGLKGWHIYLKPGQPVTDKWIVDNGAIHLTQGGAGDLVTDKEYGDFELELEWKIAEGGNSGIIYHVHEDPKFKATYNTGSS